MDDSRDHVVSRDPWTGRDVHRAPVAGPVDVEAALGRAVEASASWAELPAPARSEPLSRFAHLVEADADRLAALIAREVGKRRADADGEVAWTAESARWYADNPPGSESVGGALVRRVPLGVVAVVTPWNVPLITPAWKWLPALAAGNAVVWKPSELATGIAMRAHKLLLAAGIPHDVMQVVSGDAGTASSICGDERVDGIHFTGSERAGRALAALAAPRFARCALEMAGLNPAVVFDDADLDLAADCIVASGTALAGQKCTATRRVLVATGVREALEQRLAARIGRLRVGDPADPQTDVGPLVSADARRSAERELRRAVTAGATLLARAEAPDHPAAFAPALLADLAPDDRLRTNELFAPVIAIESFEEAAEAWNAANAAPYGLSASVFARDERLLDDATRRIRAGVIARNRRGDAVELEPPFVGRRRSGNGWPEGGEYAYASVTDLQAVY